MIEGYLTRKSICDRLEISVRTLQLWRRAGRFPAPDLVLATGQPFWLPTTFEDWKEQKNVKKPDTKPLEKLLTKTQVCDILEICTRTLDRLRDSGKFPSHDAVVGRRLRWKRSTIQAVVDGGGIKKWGT